MAFRALQTVFRNPWYLVCAGVVALVSLAAIAWLPNLSLIISVLFDGRIPLESRLALPITLLGSLATNFTLLSASYTVLIAFLFGINTALIVFYFRERGVQFDRGSTVASMLGVLSGIFGAGCAACGTFLLTALVGTAGGVTFVSMLPLHGAEFGIAGVFLLAFATWKLAGQIAAPSVCAPEMQ